MADQLHRAGRRRWRPPIRCSASCWTPGWPGRARWGWVWTPTPGAPCTTRAAGRRADIFTLGPPLRGRWYETTAIPEIRDQAAALGGLLVSSEALAGRGSAA